MNANEVKPLAEMRMQAGGLLGVGPDIIQNLVTDLTRVGMELVDGELFVRGDY